MNGDTVDELFDHAPCGLLTTDADDRVIVVNSTFLQWTGYTRDAVIGKDFHLLLDPGSQAFYGTRYQAELWSRTEMREVALTLIRADGSRMPILINAQMWQRDGGPARVRLAVFDSTSRQDYERQMLAAKRLAESSEASVRVLQEASSQFLAARSEAELGLAVAKAARDAFAAFEVAVVAYDPDGVRFHIVVGDQFRDLLDAVRSARPSARALSSDEIVFISSLDDAFALSDDVGALFRAHRAEALTAVPIADGDAVLGAFVCLFGRQQTYDQAAIELQLALARQAGLVLSRVRLQVELEQLALHDRLTGLANRTLLDERLSHARATAERILTPVSIIFVDLDGFKQINDELGHRVGDTVLHTVAARMTGVVRDGDIVGRFGGDEFLVVCENAGPEAAMAAAARIAAAIREPLSFLPDRLGVTASIGIAVYTPGVSAPQTNDSLVRLADAAMYDSKRAGADGVSLAHA